MTGVDTFAVQLVLDGTHDRSHPVTADLRALLDRLDTARAVASPGPWTNEAPFTKVIDGAGSTDFLAIVQCDSTHDAALIVAAVNALPGLLAAVRATADLVAFYDRHEYSTLNVDDLRTALAAALPEGDAPA